MSANITNPLAWITFLRASIVRWQHDGQQFPALRCSLRRWLLVCAVSMLVARWSAVRRPPATSSLTWLLGVSLMVDWHLGMIPRPGATGARPAGDPSPPTLGVPNRLTILRAFLPAAIAGLENGRAACRLRRVVASVALVSDFLDGAIAKRLDGRTHFGAVADPLADAAVWTRLAASRREGASGPGIAWIVAARYLLPLAVATIETFSCGRTFDWRPTRAGRWSSAFLASLLVLREMRMPQAGRLSRSG